MESTGPVKGLKLNKRVISQNADSVVGAFFTFLFLLLFNIFYGQIPFLTARFDPLLWLYNLSLIVAIIIHVSRVFIRSSLYRLVTEFILNTFFVIIAYRLWITFPFDTSIFGDPNTWNSIFRFLIAFPPTIAVFAMLVQLINLTNQQKEE